MTATLCLKLDAVGMLNLITILTPFLVLIDKQVECFSLYLRATAYSGCHFYEAVLSHCQK